MENETEFLELPAEEEPPSWKWQLQNSITTKEELEKHLELKQNEISYFNHKNEKRINFRITPYYLNLIINNPVLRKAVIPTDDEFWVSDGESEDPLCEDEVMPLPNIMHRYKNRVLLLSTKFCSTNCRFCTRSRLVSDKAEEDSLMEAIVYIREHKEVNDVIVSGGDPLTLPTKKLQFILSELNNIEHVKVIRIGTKVPAVLPMRIDNELVDMLSEFWRKLYINIHFTHFVELTNQTKIACLKLAKAGITLGSQTVLLKDINDDAEVLKELFQSLLSIKVIPRYLYSMDRIFGSSHFFVPLKKGKDIMAQLQGNVSGMGIPKYVVDSKNGKIPINF
jgi:lysine 2,3-aminomutase